MMSISDLRDALTSVTYRPGWKIRVYQGRHEGQHIVITTEVPDAYNPGQTTTLDVHSALPPMRDPDQFYTWLGWRLERIESHESREFYHVNGKPYDDPHAEYADRDM